jgi:hypothetical protein
MIEVRTDDLRFTTDEAAVFLNQVAVSHALNARDWQMAADLVEGHSWPLLERGEILTVAGWLTRLPEELGSHSHLGRQPAASPRWKMTNGPMNTHRSTSPVVYEIRVKGTLSTEWSDWFGGMAISHDEGDTLLTGPVVDQAAPHGLLNRIRDLGLPLLAVRRLSTKESYRCSDTDFDIG